MHQYIDMMMESALISTSRWQNSPLVLVKGGAPLPPHPLSEKPETCHEQTSQCAAKHENWIAVTERFPTGADLNGQVVSVCLDLLEEKVDTQSSSAQQRSLQVSILVIQFSSSEHYLKIFFLCEKNTNPVRSIMMTTKIRMCGKET